MKTNFKYLVLRAIMATIYTENKDLHPDDARKIAEGIMEHDPDVKKLLKASSEDRFYIFALGVYLGALLALIILRI